MNLSLREALAWALVHFLWQGAALALVAFVVMRWLRLPADARYVGVATLAAMLSRRWSRPSG